MTQPQLDAVIALCSEVFEMDYAAMMDLPLTRVHVLGYVDGRLVSHALWLERRLRVGGGTWLNAAYIEGVATQPDHRGRGYGSAVMRRVAQEIGGFDLGALSPRCRNGTSGSAGSVGAARCRSKRMASWRRLPTRTSW